MGDEDTFYGRVGCGCCLFITTLILVLTSLSQVHFYEFAFSKTWGQPINQDTVYTQGLHFLGFWTSLVVFPADIINLELKQLNVFSLALGDDAGTSLDIDVVVQYQLNPDFLSDLFDIGGETGYIKQIEAVAIEEIKNNATGFNADSYLNSRRIIERSFKTVLESALFEKFAGTQVINVQLLGVNFPSSFYARKLDVGLQEISNSIQAFNRETTKVRDITKRKVLIIENEAKQIIDVAKADAALIVDKAENDFNRIVGEANEESIGILSSALGITLQKDLLSLNYLIQMLNTPGKQKKFVNFGDTPEAKSLL